MSANSGNAAFFDLLVKQLDRDGLSAFEARYGLYTQALPLFQRSQTSA